MPPAPPPARPPVTIDEVAAELRQRRWHLGFAPAVEARFEADTQSARRRELIVGAGLALLAYDLFLINDALTRPGVLDAALFWRLAVMTPLGLLMLVAVGRGIAPRWREAGMAGTVLLGMFCAGMILLADRSPMSAYDPFAFSLVLVGGNLALPLRYPQALACSLASLVVACVFFALHPLLPSESRTMATAVLAVTLVFSLQACHRIERTMRLSYLLALREELRSEAAQRSAREFALLSQTDALTQLPNRRAFEAELQQRWQQACERGGLLGLMMIDIDHFKRFNDRFGHPAGDDCLRRVAAALQAGTRGDEFVARLGGEEFVMLFDAARPAAVTTAAERMRVAVESLAIPHDRNDGLDVVTISLGAACSRADGGAGPHRLLAQADGALYRAKRDGRNRWVISTGVSAGGAAAEAAEEAAALI